MSSLQSNFNSLQPINSSIQFVSPNPSYTCESCKGYLVDPHQLICGHRICSNCKGNFQGGVFDCPSGDETCEKVSYDKIYPDNSLRRELKDYDVYCTNKSLGCAVTCKLYHLKKHLEEECLYVKVNCPHDCNLIDVFKYELNEHLETCPMKPVKCQFHKIGCDYMGLENVMHTHISNSVAKHLELAATSMHKMFQKYDSLRNSVKENSLKIMEQNDMIMVLNEKHNEVIRKSDMLEKVANDAKLQESKMKDFQSKLSQLKSEVEKAKDAFNFDSEEKKWLREIKTQTDEQAASLESQRKSFVDFELKLQCLETTNYSGVLIWKINEFKRRLAEAKQGNRVSVYSQPFFTSRYGYRMCARLYLNGDGLGANHYVSFFFVIMKGEYDDVLTWPFKQKVTLKLLSQNPNRPLEIKDGFKPDPLSSSFQKPTSLMNLATGCPRFISHKELLRENSDYLKDDTIFFKIIVDISDLPT